jgi:hypothetical protein
MELDLLVYGVPYREISEMGEEEFIDYWTIATDKMMRELEAAQRKAH